MKVNFLDENDDHDYLCETFLDDLPRLKERVTVYDARYQDRFFGKIINITRDYTEEPITVYITLRKEKWNQNTKT